MTSELVEVQPTHPPHSTGEVSKHPTHWWNNSINRPLLPAARRYQTWVWSCFNVTSELVEVQPTHPPHSTGEVSKHPTHWWNNSINRPLLVGTTSRPDAYENNMFQLLLWHRGFPWATHCAPDNNWAITVPNKYCLSEDGTQEEEQPTQSGIRAIKNAIQTVEYNIITANFIRPHFFYSPNQQFLNNQFSLPLFYINGKHIFGMVITTKKEERYGINAYTKTAQYITGHTV